MFKKILKILLPKPVVKRIKYLMGWVVAYSHFAYDKKKYIEFSGTYSFDKKEKLLAVIIAHYHVLEKGLSMVERRTGFGQDVAINLIKLLRRYDLGGYGCNCRQYLVAVGVLEKYKQFHDDMDFFLNIPEDDLRWLSTVRPDCPVDVGDKIISKAEIFETTSASFDRFVKSRYSVRNFSGHPVHLDDLYDAIRIAQKSPSACNRQSSKVYMVSNKEMLGKVMQLQTGNRGFGHLADKVLVVTSDLQAFHGINERNQAYIDGGIFSMSVLYALHFKQSAACALNWAVLKEQDVLLHSLLGIPECEEIIMLIAVGHFPDEFRVACSPRKILDEVVIN